MGAFRRFLLLLILLYDDIDCHLICRPGRRAASTFDSLATPPQALHGRRFRFDAPAKADIIAGQAIFTEAAMTPYFRRYRRSGHAATPPLVSMRGQTMAARKRARPSHARRISDDSPRSAITQRRALPPLGTESFSFRAPGLSTLTDASKCQRRRRDSDVVIASAAYSPTDE